MHAEKIRQASGRDRVRAASGQVSIECFPAPGEQSLEVVRVTDADKNAGAAAFQFLRRLCGVFQGFPADFEQQPLLWVHAQRLAWRDVEEMRIEAIHAREKAAVARVHLARRVRIGIVIARDIPAVRRHFADRIDAVAEQTPETFRIVSPAGKPTPDTDDGDRLLARLFRCSRACSVIPAPAGQAASATDWRCDRRIQTWPYCPSVLSANRRSTSCSERSSRFSNR